MCSPDLTQGVCQVCTGTLTPETTYVDRDGNVWDVHKGVCAIHAGEVPQEHVARYSWYVERLRKASTQAVRNSIIRSFYRWIEEVSTENHYEKESEAQRLALASRLDDEKDDVRQATFKSVVDDTDW